jgi:hypothetical protein
MNRIGIHVKYMRNAAAMPSSHSTMKCGISNSMRTATPIAGMPHRRPMPWVSS